jgi:peptidyl-tRNA hydrolase, PTH1 family
MVIVVGLGNPGEQYSGTRHNIGFGALDVIATLLKAPQFSSKPKLHGLVSKQGNIVLLKPTTYMNRSGEAARAVIEYYGGVELKKEQLTNVFVVHDDLDIPLGSFKIQLGTGPKQHNGLLSLYDHLGTSQFWHVRIGVDARGGDRSIPPDRYVLQQPTAQEQKQLNEVVNTAVSELLVQIQKVQA